MNVRLGMSSSLAAGKKPWVERTDFRLLGGLAERPLSPNRAFRNPFSSTNAIDSSAFKTGLSYNFINLRLPFFCHTRAHLADKDNETTNLATRHWPTKKREMRRYWNNLYASVWKERRMLGQKFPFFPCQNWERWGLFSFFLRRRLALEIS